MLRLVSERILGAASQKKAAAAWSSLPVLLLLPRSYQERVVYRCNNYPQNNLGSTVGTGSIVEAPTPVTEYGHIVPQRELQFSEKDTLTEGSLWELYKRWMKFHGISRSPNEIHERFESFKATVRDTHRYNLIKWQPEDPVGLNELSDTIEGDPFWGEYGTGYSSSGDEGDDDEEDQYMCNRFAAENWFQK